MNRKPLFSLGLAALLPAASQAVKPVEKPNILFILADDLGYGDLACYGNKVIQTPVIDQLCAEGMHFTNSYAGASVSSPSRCCLMTGLNTGHGRIRGNTCKVGGLQGEREGVPGLVRRTSLQKEDVTIAELLQNQGYRTCLVNKWHLDGFDSTATPMDRGFDEFYGWLIPEPKSQNYYPSVRWRNREKFTIEANLNGQHGDHNTDRSTDEAISFLDRTAQKQPFFLYLAYNAPHVPLDAKDRTLYLNSGLPEVDQSYAALVSHMDASIGRVLQELHTLGLDKNTLVVFASDNGGATAAEVKQLKLNGNLRGFKGELWEGGIRVPLMVRWPGHIKPGTTSSQPCYFPDFFPTFAKLAGVTNLEEDVRGMLRQKMETDYFAPTKESVTDGVDLMPALKGKKLPNRWLYWEQFPKTGLSQAVRFGNWKAVRMDLKDPWMLFNLKTDPAETTDVAARNPKVIAAVNAYIATARHDSECWPVD
jgi:arylsulfatase A-like enzyme